ncbi:MAG: hypothetical protein II579_04920 [Treponema sp.]|nr:hypothetical protein [Treponema sp.]
MAAYDPRKSIHGFSWVLKNCIAVLQAAKPRIHALFTIWQEKDKLSLDFFRIAESLAILHVAKPRIRALFTG